MYQYQTLENVSKTLLYDTFLEAFQGFAIVSKADIGDFYDLLENNKYDSMISVGAFRADTNELVAFVLNSIINAESKKTRILSLLALNLCIADRES